MGSNLTIGTAVQLKVIDDSGVSCMFGKAKVADLRLRFRILVLINGLHN